MSCIGHIWRPRYWPLSASSEMFCERCGALAAGAQSDETTQLAQSEGRQSGGESRNAQPQASHKYSMKEKPNG